MAFVGFSGCTTNETETATEVETAETTTDAMTEDEAIAMDTWDADRFSTSFDSNNKFDAWDLDDDGMLDENEFGTTFYSTWDANRDNMLDENEWNAGVADFGLTGQSWAAWDANKDNALSSAEFNAGLKQQNYMRNWDKDNDGRINKREYTDGVFMLWDTNRDGMLDTNEYNTRYNRYYGL